MEKQFARSPEQLADIVTFTHEFLDAHGRSALRNVLDLCIEELFINMVTYNTETDSDILIGLENRPEGVAVITTFSLFPEA